MTEDQESCTTVKTLRSSFRAVKTVTASTPQLIPKTLTIRTKPLLLFKTTEQCQLKAAPAAAMAFTI